MTVLMEEIVAAAIIVEDKQQQGEATTAVAVAVIMLWRLHPQGEATTAVAVIMLWRLHPHLHQPLKQHVLMVHHPMLMEIVQHKLQHRQRLKILLCHL